MRIFLAYFGCLLLGAGFVAPVAFFVLDGLITYPFHRYVNRALMINALLFIILFRRHFQLRGSRDLGFQWETNSWRQICSGVIIGTATLFFVVSVEWLAGGRHGGGDYELWHVINVLIRATVTALLVAPAEEFLFRWTFQRSIVKPLREWKGILLLSFIFALVHFLKVPPEFKPNPVKWYSGFEAVLLMFQSLLSPATIGPKFLSLWFAGISLSWLVVRTGTLWAAIALHATWIFLREITVRLSVIPPNIETFWSSPDLTSGGLALIVLAVLSIGIWFYYPRYTRT